MTEYIENEVPSEAIPEKLAILIAEGATLITLTLVTVGVFKLTYNIDP